MSSTIVEVPIRTIDGRNSSLLLSICHCADIDVATLQFEVYIKFIKCLSIAQSDSKPS